MSFPMTQSNSSRKYRHHALSGASAEPARLMMMTQKGLVLHRRHCMRRRGIEPRPIAWKAIMLTTTPTPLVSGNQDASYTMHNWAKTGLTTTKICLATLHVHGLFVCLTTGCYSAHGRFNSDLLQLASTTLQRILSIMTLDLASAFPFKYICCQSHTLGANESVHSSILSLWQQRLVSCVTWQLQ